MPILSLVHTKGGVAKTTSAMYLAAAAASRGLDVVLVDADPQGSALEWAAAVDGPMPFPVVPASRPLIIERGHGLTIVDTPPGTAQVIQEGLAGKGGVRMGTRRPVESGQAAPQRRLLRLARGADRRMKAGESGKRRVHRRRENLLHGPSPFGSDGPFSPAEG